MIAGAQRWSRVRGLAQARGLPPALFAAAALAWAAGAAAATQVMVISGLGGEPQYEQRFTQWGEKVAAASATATGDPQRVYLLTGADARRELIEQRLTALARALKEGDQFVLVLIGHGSFDGNEYRLNIPGPDLTGTELGAMLDRIPNTVMQLVIDCTSASGAIADKWARPYRVVVTATKSGGERNATRFAGYWAEALTSDAADRDKDGAVNAQEAYDYANRKVAESFKSDAALVTEHARLTGTDPARFVVARLGTAAMFASDGQLIALRAQQEDIQRRLAQLKPLKAQLSEDEYFNRIEPVLVELARVGERVDARLAALSTGGSGARR